MNKTEFSNLLDSNSNVVLLDIREPEELLVEETIFGSKNITMGKIFTAVSDGLLTKGKPIVVFCRSGKRAGIVARELSTMGFDIQALEGGLQALRNNL
jgi:phage shock protein E